MESESWKAFEASIDAEVERELDQHIALAFNGANPSAIWVRAERSGYRPYLRRAAINRRLFYGH